MTRICIETRSEEHTSIGTVISNNKNTRYIVLKSWLPIAPRLVKPNIEGFAPAKPLIITYPANAARRTKKNTAMQ